MNCKICKSKKINITYHGKIRDGRVGNYTFSDVDMFVCEACGVIWHEPLKESGSFYESKEYREQLEGTSDIADFYSMHDGESKDKFNITGVECFRNRLVADVGCGGGAFLDYINTVAKEIIAIEPSETYRIEMGKKGYTTFAYSRDAISSYKGKIDTIVSFDVIEHVDDPKTFLAEIYDLLASGGGSYCWDTNRCSSNEIPSW